MIDYPTPLLAVGGARTGIAPVNLLDVLDVNGNLYFWSDRRIVAPYAMNAYSIPAELSNPVTPAIGQYVAWVRPTVVTLVQDPVATASGNIYGGGVSCGGSEPGTTLASATWSGFKLPTLPPSAIIDAVYAVAYVTVFEANCAYAGDNIAAAVGLTSTPINLSSVPDFSMEVAMGSSVPFANASGTWTVKSPAIAVYYHFTGSPFTPAVAVNGFGSYQPWLLTVPKLTFHRSSVTDVGSFVVQNLSGDTLSRDMEKILRKSAMEGAFFVYRCWQPDAQAAWREVHGKLTVDDVGVDTITLKGAPAINPAEEDSPVLEYCETCQWRWGSAQCGATGSIECSYSFQSCQVPERILVVLNNYEKNYGETIANTPTQIINRRRRF